MVINVNMKPRSPAKILHDVKRITRFLSKKNESKIILSVQMVNICDIPPVPRSKPRLSVVQVQTTNVIPLPKPNLTISRATSVDIPPDVVPSPYQPKNSEALTKEKFLCIMKDMAYKESGKKRKIVKKKRKTGKTI